MKKRFVSVLLVLALALGLGVPALAAGPSFADVPESYWGYADIEAVAEAGLMKGTGGDLFAPELKVSVAQFLTLLGRLVFPDVKAEGADWYGPYVTAAQDAKLLDGTQVDTGNVEAEISRYDMAVILRAAAKKLGVAEKSAQSSEVKDYLDIPTRYADAVLAVYGMGLIKGDQAGNFNGSNTMMRAEVATVIMRLARATGNQGGNTTEPEQPTEPELFHTVLSVRAFTPEQYSENKEGERTVSDVPLQLRYTEDGGNTSRLITEFSSYRAGSGNFVSVTLDIDQALVDNENGQFYFSGETEYNGQRLVTQDLRTDGRATIIPVKLEPLGRVKFHDAEVEMVPPTGFKRNITIRGSVHANTFDSALMPNISVDFKLYRDATGKIPGSNDVGTVMGSTVTDEDGAFRIETTLDTLDWILSTKCYRIEAHGMYQGKEWVTESWMKFMSLDEITSLEEWRLPKVWVEMKPI